MWGYSQLGDGEGNLSISFEISTCEGFPEAAIFAIAYEHWYFNFLKRNVSWAALLYNAFLFMPGDFMIKYTYMKLSCVKCG